jgi:histidinol-phosphate phosphatase HisN, inositol monophosphatase family
MLPDLSFLDALAHAAAAETLPRFRAAVTVDNKHLEGFDPVTEADRAAERAIRALIKAEYPDHGIFGEEYGTEGGDRDLVWVIDPIDGTRAFIAGLPSWGTLIGLYERGRAVMGMMDQPFTGERYLAGPSGSFLRHAGKTVELRTRKGVAIEDAVLMTTSPFLYASDVAAPYRALESRVRLARYGFDCYAFAMLAAGHIDICVESGLKPYDIAGLISPIEQAGGVVSDWQGGRPEQGGNILAAATPELHAAALDILNSGR